MSIITRSFLKGSEDELLGFKFTKAATSHRTVFVPLMKNLREARYEHYVRGTEKEYILEKSLVECLQVSQFSSTRFSNQNPTNHPHKRLAQHIGGLRSAASTQFSLLAQAQKLAAETTSPVETQFGLHRVTTEGPQLFTPPHHDSYINSPQHSNWPSQTGSDVDSDASTTMEDPTAPITIFDQFIFHLGPPMKSLAYTLKLMLDELPFSSGPKYRIRVNVEFRESLKKAIEMYSEARIEALNTLYRSEAVTKARPMAEAADVEEIAASCGYFSSCLLYFAEEMIIFLDILEGLENLQREKPRTWEWMKFWKKGPGKTNRDVEGKASLRSRGYMVLY